MSLLPARSAVEQGRLSGDCRSGRPVPTLPAAEGDMGLRLAWCAALAKAFAAAVVTVPSLPPQIIVNILPSQATLEVNRTQRFSAVVSGAADPRSPGPSPKEAPAAPSTATASTQLEERRRHIGDVVGGR